MRRLYPFVVALAFTSSGCERTVSEARVEASRLLDGEAAICAGRTGDCNDDLILCVGVNSGRTVMCPDDDGSPCLPMRFASGKAERE